MQSHFLAFIQLICEQDQAELAPPLHDGEECWYLPSFVMYHNTQPDKIRVAFVSSASHLGISLTNVLLTGPDINNSLLGVLIWFRCEQKAITPDIEQRFHFLVKEE